MKFSKTNFAERGFLIFSLGHSSLWWLPPRNQTQVQDEADEGVCSRESLTTIGCEPDILRPFSSSQHPVMDGVGGVGVKRYHSQGKVEPRIHLGCG